MSTQPTQDPTDRYTLLAEEVLRIGEAQGARGGIAGLVGLLICDILLCIIGLLASRAGQARAATLADTAAPRCAAAPGRLADEVQPRPRVARRHAGVSGVRAVRDAGAACGPLASVVEDAAAGSCATRENSLRPQIRAPRIWTTSVGRTAIDLAQPGLHNPSFFDFIPERPGFSKKTGFRPGGTVLSISLRYRNKLPQTPTGSANSASTPRNASIPNPLSELVTSISMCAAGCLRASASTSAALRASAGGLTASALVSTS
jgi:hypothetical protein